MGVRVLLIEDDLVLQDSIFELLHQYGFVVEAFANPKQALKRFKEIKFDIILCDYKMPEMDGNQVLKKIKDLKPDHHIPFIMLTAYTDSKIYRQAMNLGADDFLNKPFKSDDLIKAVNKELEKAKFWRLKVEGFADFPQENPNPIIRYYFNEEVLDYANPSYIEKLKELNESERKQFVGQLTQIAKMAYENRKNIAQDIPIRSSLYNVTFSPQLAKGYVNIYFSDITIVKSKEEQIRSQQQFYKELLDNIPADIAVFTPDMRYIYINPNGVKNPEVREWMIGKTDQDYIEYRKPKNTETIERRMAAFRAAKENGENANWVDEYTLKDGSKQFIVRKFHPVLNENNRLNFMIGYGIDVTQNILAERELIESKTRYKNLFDSNPQMVFIINAQGIVYEINKAAVEQLGYTSEELVNQSVLKVFPEQYHSAVLETIENCFNEEHIEHTWELVKHKKDGTLIDVFEVARTIHLHDQNEKVLLIVCTDITDNKRNLALLKETSDFNKMLLKEMPVPVAILQFDKFVEVNGTFKNLFGYDSEQLKGLSLFNYVLEKYHCNLQIKMQERYENALKVVECEVEMLSIDNKKYNILLNGTLYTHQGEKYTLVIFNNITDIRQAQLREREADHRSNLILNGTLDAVIQFNKKGIIIDWNRQAEDLFEYTAQEAIGKDIGELIIPDKYSILKVRGTEFYLQNTIDKVLNRLVEFTTLSKSGSFTEVELYAIEIELSGEVIYTAFLRNIQERKNAENQAKMFVNELTRQNEELRRFAYITSHDLRAPVINLMALLEHYDTANPASELNIELISLFKQSTERISATLNDLLEITKVKDKIQGEKIEKCDIVQIINNTKVEFAEMILSVGPKFELELNGITQINFSYNVLKSVFSNLISNALKFCSKERDLIIKITAEVVSNFIVIRVIDNGLGMDMTKTENRLLSLYQKFHHKTAGKGFGLYLLKLQLEALNSTIDFNSTINVGTEFIVKIPIKNVY